ncbi:MAG: hypothetical protein ABSF32_04515 [Ignavibacteria bacterium]|jgi:hypothetical protein
MRKKILFTFIKGKAVKFLLFLSLISFPFSGSDCGNSIVGGNPGELAGKWQLMYMTGYLEDVCLGEVVDYFTNGTVTLKCPNSEQITRNYAVSNNILTYQPSGLQYDITSLTTVNLVLTGRNVSRTLSYNRLPTDSKAIEGGTAKGSDSSEKPQN